VPKEHKKGDTPPPPENKKSVPKPGDKAARSGEYIARPPRGSGARGSDRSVAHSDSYTIRRSNKPSQSAKTDREIARERLLAAGRLVTNLGIPDNLEPPASDEELEQLGQLPEGARGSEELVNEDRGEY
jgi:hypothetical protein